MTKKIDWTQNRKFYGWTFMENARMYDALEKYGYKMHSLGIFSFEVFSDGTIEETGTDISKLMPYKEKWPHINWYLTIMNHGVDSRFTAIRENINGAQDVFISEIHRILDKYPWAVGVDIDLERGGEIENKAKANALFKRIYNEVKGRGDGKLVHADLPAMVGPNQSVGGENWCDYSELHPYLDSFAIMSYGMSWAGSAPGSVSPTWWIEDIYEYAASVAPPEKIYMGLPAYGWEWQIYETPASDEWRGIAYTYYAALYQMQGRYTFHPEQRNIPWAGFWDWTDMSGYIYPHIYDLLEGWDTIDRPEYPKIRESYGGTEYLTTYSKEQKNSSTGIIVDRDATPSTSSGNLQVNNGEVSFQRTSGQELSNGKAIYNIQVNTAGTYDVIVQVNFPWWDQNKMKAKLNGTTYNIGETRAWYPYWRTFHWRPVRKSIYLSRGQHTLEIFDASPGTGIRGIQIVQQAKLEHHSGSAKYSLKPRKFKTVEGDWVAPEQYIITTEALRRDPESALIWYEDWRDYGPSYGGDLPSWFTKKSGEWEVEYDSAGGSRPYSELVGTGEVELRGSSLGDTHISARLGIRESNSGRVGIYNGNVKLEINYTTKRLELRVGNTLLNSVAYDIPQGSSVTIAMRIRGKNIRVYTGTSEGLRFTDSSNSVQTGQHGITSSGGGKVFCSLWRVGDSWRYYPQEKYDLKLPDGTIESYGRLNRTGVIWNNEFDIFEITSDIEERETRSESISMDYDYGHSAPMALTAGEDYEVEILNTDPGVWNVGLYLGDSRGFSIVWYPDVDTIAHFASKAAYDYKLRGIAIWALGQEDLRVWEALPDVVPAPIE